MKQIIGVAGYISKPLTSKEIRDLMVTILVVPRNLMTEKIFTIAETSESKMAIAQRSNQHRGG